ncbi:hypothetical protein [Paraburkholderia dipogonis]|uniref:hypothetical protein n=1 Tax=Paraburkholderia dipogonis TaxID=1211383 RepID=UPI0038B9E8E9
MKIGSQPTDAEFMATGGSDDDKLRIYALANPALIVQERDAVQRAVFEAFQIAPSDQRQLTISESSASFDYAVVGELWRRKTPPALPAPEDALKAAESMLSRLERKCSAANEAWPELLRAIALLPPVGLLRRAGLHVVARPDGSAWDHWLYRAEPQLLLDGGAKNRAGVFGTQLEVRIGHLGQVIGVRSRWHPLSGERISADPTPFRVPVTDTPQADASGTTPPVPVIKFVLDGEGIPQFYLAPYYLYSDGDEVRATSASPWSLTVDVGRTRQQESQMRLTALAQGGSGDYLYNWAVYSLADVDKGFAELGSGRTDVVESVEGWANASSVDLENGHYTVMLNVKDRATGAFKHHQQLVFSSAFTSESEGPTPLS